MTGSIKILVVDDSKVSRTVVIGLIKNRRPDAQILEAGNGREAIDIALRERPELSVLDINMPDVSGIEVAEHLRANAPELRLAILTANVQDAMKAKADALNVPLYRKPAKGDIVDQILSQLEAA